MIVKRVVVALVAVLVLALAAAGAAALAWRELNAPLPSAAEGAWLRIAERDAVCAASRPTSRSAACSTSRGCSRPYARLTGEATRVRAGEYQLGEGTTPLTLLAKLVSGDVYLHQITIVEGSRFAEVLAALALASGRRSHGARTAPRS